MSNIVPLEEDVRKHYLSGHTISELAKMFGLPRFTLSKILDHPTCHTHMHGRLQTIRFRATEFRLRAFEQAEESLEKLIEIRDTATDENLKRLASKDIIKFAGLEPRKVVEIHSHNSYGIDHETRSFYESVLQEAGGEAQLKQDIIDAELTESPQDD